LLSSVLIDRSTPTSERSRSSSVKKNGFAAATLMQLVGAQLGTCRAQTRRQEGRVLHGQATEREEIDPDASRPLADDREQRVRGGHLGVAKSTEQQQRHLQHRGREEVEQEQRRVVGAVQVIEDQQQRLPAGVLDERRRGGIEQLEPVGAGCYPQPGVQQRTQVGRSLDPRPGEHAA
jgi:hypothetical protein